MATITTRTILSTCDTVYLRSGENSQIPEFQRTPAENVAASLLQTLWYAKIHRTPAEVKDFSQFAVNLISQLKQSSPLKYVINLLDENDMSYETIPPTPLYQEAFIFSKNNCTLGDIIELAHQLNVHWSDGTQVFGHLEHLRRSD